MSASLLRRRFITRTFYRSRVRKSSLKMEEAEAFPEEETTGRSLVDGGGMHQRRIGRRREDTSRSRSSSASCSPRVSDGGGGIITPRRDPRPSFFPSSSATRKAADGLRVKSRRKKPQGRVNEEDDFDRGERGDESGEKEEEKSVSS